MSCGLQMWFDLSPPTPAFSTPILPAQSLSSIWRGNFYIKLELILTKYRGIQREGDGEVVKERVKGVKYMEMEEDLTLGCGYTMQYKDDVS